jgi:hypothetical protein
MVGFTWLKAAKPRDESVDDGSDKPNGGVELPSPLAASAGKIWTVPAPEISSSIEPKSQLAVVPPNVPVKVLAAPTGEDPATVTTPAPLVQ